MCLFDIRGLTRWLSGNEGLDVEGLGVGKIQGDQEHDTAEHI